MSESHTSPKRKRGTSLAYASGWYVVFLNQLADRFAVVEDVHRSAVVVREGLHGIDAEGAIDGAQNLRRRAAAIAREFAASVRRADDLAHLQAAAGDHRRHRVRPMSTAIRR